MNISESIKYYRQKNHLTQKSLANLLNVSDKTISSWENHRTCPDTDMLRNLSKIFKVSVDDLLKEYSHSNHVNHILKYNKNIFKYRKYLLFFNILLVCLSYFEITELFGFHFPIINIFNILFIIFSFLFIKFNFIHIFSKSNIILFSFSMIFLFFSSHIFTNVLNVVNGNSETYIRGFIMGRSVLLCIVSILIVFEKIIIQFNVNKN